MDNLIRITCETKDQAHYGSLVPFQGNLKDLSEENYKKLRGSIIEKGFAFAPHVWESEGKLYLIDGHQRIRTVKQMVEQEGFTCPLIPIVKVQAESFEKAAELVLAATSEYGEMTSSGLYEFLHTHNIPLDTVEQKWELRQIDFEEYREEFIDGAIQGHGISPDVPFSSEIDEKNDYIVILFRDRQSFITSCEKLGLGSVQTNLSTSGNPNFQIQGQGRIIDAEKVIDRL